MHLLLSMQKKVIRAKFGLNSRAAKIQKAKNAIFHLCFYADSEFFFSKIIRQMKAGENNK